MAGYICTDKPVYKPGHTVHIKAVFRWRSSGALVPFDRPDVELRITDPNDKVVYRERLPVDDFGSIEASFTVPPGAALGSYSIHVQSGDDSSWHSFGVQE